MGHNTLRDAGSAQACIRLASLTLAVLLSALGQAQVLYETGFEPDEGYDMKSPLPARAVGSRKARAAAAWLKKLSPTWAIRHTSVFPPEKDDESYLNLWRPITVPKTGPRD